MKKKKIPHLFSKIVVWWCVIYATIFSAASLFVLWHRGVDATGILSVTLGMFGGELALMAMRKIIGERRQKNESGIYSDAGRYPYGADQCDCTGFEKGNMGQDAH